MDGALFRDEGIDLSAPPLGEFSTNAATRARAPRHVLHVITRLLQGGAEENTVCTCLNQAARGDRVTLVHGPDSHPSWCERLSGKLELITVASLDQPISVARDAKAVRELAALFRRLAPDVVHTHQSKAGILGRLAATQAGVPLIVHTVHIAPFLNVRGAKRWLYIAAERLCARSTHLFISVSHGMRNAFIEQGIGKGKPFEVIHSGMPLDRFVTAKAPTDWRSRIGGWESPETPKFILMLAAFEPRKRQREFLSALAATLRTRPHVCVLLAGAGSELERCRDQARSLGIEYQVRFLGHDSGPHELIALADICVLTSEREGLPRVAVQYVAAGKPVVLSRLPGIEELIVDGANGAVTDPDDLADTAARIFALLDDEERLARLAAGARATDVSRWSEQAMCEQIEDAYARVEAELNPAGRAQPKVAVIEFFGLPGAGKTAVARAVMVLLAEKGRPFAFSGDIMGDRSSLPRRSLRRLAMVAQFLLRHSQLAFRIARSLGTARGGTRDVAKSLWNRVSVEAMLRHQSRDPGLLVLDQGRLQAEWSQLMHGWDPHEAGIVSEGRLDRSLFVYVEAPSNVARDRLAGRGTRTSRMQRADRLGQRSLWDRGQAMLDRLMHRLETGLAGNSLQSQLLRISNGEGADPTRLAIIIVAHLEQLEASR